MSLGGFARERTPLGASVAAVADEVGAELDRALPDGWRIERFPGPDIAWRIYQNDADSDFRVIVPASLDLVIFTHGNSDAGALRLTHFLLNALVIEASALREFGMGACIQHLVSRCRPNSWGMS